MSNQTIRRLFGGLGTVLILIVSGVIIAAHFLTERNLQRINVSDYVKVSSDGAGGYTFSLDVEEMLYREHLTVPPESDEDRYPEIAALRTLDVRATERNGAYALETISSSTDTKFNETLKKGGIKLSNTQWTWTKEQAAAKAQTDTPGIRQFRFADYIRTSREADGSWRADLDVFRLMREANVAFNADPEIDAGARALRSLGVMCRKDGDGYLLEASSADPSILDDLTAAGMQIIGTRMTWTEADMEAHLGAVETPTPIETAAPTAEPETTEEPTPPETHETPSPTEAPTTAPARIGNEITTLYGFDQTDVRKAIRAAKEAKYGSRLDSSEIVYNCFAVGSAETEHGNVFRVVYLIKASVTEYLIADVYDLESSTGYKASDVQLRTATNEKNAKNTDDLAGYTVYTLEGGSMVFEENKGKNPFDSDGLVMPKSLTEKLSNYELWNIPQTKDKTLLQLLGFARNEMFARGGLKFKDTSSYYTYYKQFDWYNPTGNVTVDDLAKKYPMTRTNIDTIKFLENLIKNG